MNRKHKVFVAIGGDRLYTIVSNYNAGRRNRFTVHVTHLFGLHLTTVIGQELPIGLSKKIAQNHVERYADVKLLWNTKRT